MNKIIFGLVCSILLCKILPVSAAPKAPPEDTKRNLNKLEARAAAFLPMSSKVRELYGDVGTSLQLEASRTWKNHRIFEVWLNGEWIFMDGTQPCGITKLDIINISFGVKIIGKIYKDFVFLYGGLGPNVGLIYVDDCSTDRKHVHLSRVAIGGVAKFGSQIFFNRHFYLDLFTDYLYLPVHFSRTLDMGGFKIGGGLGARF